MAHESPDHRTAVLTEIPEDFEVRDALLEWIRANPERIDRAI